VVVSDPRIAYVTVVVAVAWIFVPLFPIAFCGISILFICDTAWARLHGELPGSSRR